MHFSLTTKILIIFLVLSMVSLVVVGSFSFINMWKVSDYVLKSSTALGEIAISDSTNVMENLGAQIIEQKSRDVVKQCEIYIKSHPNMRLTDLQKSTEFQKIAVQPVGKTGYTALIEYAIPACRFHINPKIVNLDLHTLAKKLPGFWGVMSLCQEGKESFGYYDWEEADGSIKKKYMHIIPIKAKTADGIEMSMAATTYIDEFSKPVEAIKGKMSASIQKNKEHIEKQINDTQNTFIGIFITILLLLVAGLASLLSRTITQPIKMLKKGSEAVGKGDLDYKVEVKTGDELEELADSFNKMSSDLKKYIDELRLVKEKEREELIRWNKRLEEKVEERTRELDITNKQLQEVSQAKSAFLANMSHELRTPLNSIIGFSEILLEKTFGEMNEKQTKYANNIYTSGKHLLTLINDILDLSKVEAGKIELKIEEFSLQEILTECQTLVKSLAGKKNIWLEVKIEGISTIKADPVRFKQIMYNLFSNAIKFTPDKGRVDVTAKPVDEMVQITVQDTGIGIAKEHYEKVFDEFQQIDSSYSKQYQGTGLGLPLTRKLVELHGGKIWLESEPGKGSTFTFTIPQGKGSGVRSQGSGEEEILTPEEKGGGPVVLVVEDEEQARELLTVYLEEGGYQVAYAVDGEEAIKKAREIKPYAITLDVILPKKSGFEVLQELKILPETRDIPVIIVSMIDNKEQGLGLGAVDYLIKPVDKNRLTLSLEKHNFTTKAKEKAINILVVDDNPQDIELISSMLEPEGFGIIKAYGGEEGIEIATEKQPDAIILDLMMPEVNGFEVVQILKKDKRTKNIPIIICTSKDLTKEDMQLLNSNIVSIMQKGKCSKEELLEELKKIEKRERIQNPEYRIQNTKYKIQDTEYRI